MEAHFADGISNIAVTGAVVRIEFATASQVPGAEGKAEVRLNPSHQVVLPLESFVRAFGAQEQIIRRLIADGVIKLPAGAKAAAAEPAPAAA